MSKRITIGIDGDHICVGLGELHEPTSKWHFEPIISDTKAFSIRNQMFDAYEKWCERFPEEGRLPFDIDMEFA